MEEKLVKIWKKLHKKPKRYDFVSEEFFQSTEIELKTILKFVNFKNKIILDVGGGSGRLAIPLSKLAKKIFVIDPEKEMLEQLKVKVKKNNIENIEIKNASAEKIPYPDESFDIAMCAWILPYINLEKAFGEMKRVLKKGGWLIVIDHYGNDDWEKLTIIENPKHKKRYDKRNKKVLNLIKDFQIIKTKIVDSFLKFPNLAIARKVINEVRGTKASEYIVKNKILKISNKIIFIFAKK
jgi:ubiquinone/menaquinone biosynthesis C-methylase UbiE